MGFYLFGYKFFDFSSKVTYQDAFITMFIVFSLSLIILLLLNNIKTKN